jgi:hypothetical protein
MLWTQSPYFIIFSDLYLSYINLNNMVYTRSHDNDHLCFNPSINDDLMVRIHIFISNLNFDINLGHRGDYNTTRFSNGLIEME